jgi:hypothetical protein
MLGVIGESLEKSCRTRAVSVDIRELPAKRTPSEQVIAMIVGKREGLVEFLIDRFKGFKCLCFQFFLNSPDATTHKSHSDQLISE